MLHNDNKKLVIPCIQFHTSVAHKKLRCYTNFHLSISKNRKMFIQWMNDIHRKCLLKIYKKFISIFSVETHSFEVLKAEKKTEFENWMKFKLKPTYIFYMGHLSVCMHLNDEMKRANMPKHLPEIGNNWKV